MDAQRLKIILKSKTFWGTVATATAVLLQQSPITLGDWFAWAGAIIAASGIRDAITQHGITPPSL